MGQEGKDGGADAEGIEVVFRNPGLAIAQGFGVAHVFHAFRQGPGGGPGVLGGVFKIGEKAELHGGSGHGNSPGKGKIRGLWGLLGRGADRGRPPGCPGIRRGRRCSF